jgi:hypothetical protein
MLSRLVSFAVVMALVYFALTRGLPWIREQIAPTARSYEAADGDTAAPAGACIESVARANDSLGQLVRRFGTGPVDADEWSTNSWAIESELRDAEMTCTCLSEACRKAAEAASELRTMYSQFDAMARGTATGYGNPARNQERVFDLLDEARSLAGY